MKKTTISTLISGLLTLSLHAQSDNFDDGDDQGWTRIDPIAEAGGGTTASFAFTDGAYRLSSTASPDENLLGPSRAGAFRLDRIYTDKVFLSVDIKIPNPELRQAVGFLTMVQPVMGPGMTDGYSINWQPADTDLVINRIIDESPTRLALADLLTPADYAAGQRLTVSIESGIINASLYNLTDLVNPIAQASVEDIGVDAYSSGTAGLFLYSDVNNPTGTTNAIFDNYEANDGTITLPQRPPSPTITRTPTGQIHVTVPISTLATHHLQQSPTLGPNATWTNIPNEFLQTTPETSRYVTAPDIETTRFFRLSEGPLDP